MSHVEVRQIGHVAATPVAKTLTANGRTQNKKNIATLLLKAIALREAEMKKTDIRTVEGQETKRRG